MFKQTYIVSDNKEMLDYAKELGFLYTLHYPCGTEKDLLYLEYFATYRYAVENNYHPDWFILLNVRQLFKNDKLLLRCLSNIDDKYDIVASYTTISNKSNFFIDDDFMLKHSTSHLLHSKHDRKKMVDSSLYIVKTKFAFECMQFDDPAEHFWKGKIKFVNNESLYTNIYDYEDIEKFYRAAEIIEDVKQLENN